MKHLPFLWEIGCEEFPADWLPELTEQLRSEFAKQIEESRLGAPQVETYSTSRRLVVHVPKLPERQPDLCEEVTGPPARIARSESGEWSAAALGFARKKQIELKNLKILETPKGQYVGFVRQVRGQAVKKLLPSIMAASLRGLSFPKFMNWDAEIPDGRGAFPFGRAIRWMVCLLGSRVVPFEIQVGDATRVRTGAKSRGHRFLGPKRGRDGTSKGLSPLLHVKRVREPSTSFTVTSFRELKQGLRRHSVLLDPEDRLARLEKEIEKREGEAGAKRASRLRGLTTRFLADLVEWPGTVLGTYPDEFSSLPVDVVHTVLIHHQKYIPLEGKPAFIAVTNMPTDPKGFIRKGSERVVVARLRDAKFFWDEDLKMPLESRKEALDGVLFHEKLGSTKAKVDRVVPLARWLAEDCGVPTGPVERAAILAKCDLTTGMVREFSELQGIMGGLYAREQGETEEIWKAIYSHYRPTGLGDEEDFPLNREGALLSLADKVDTLAGMFSVGVVPTGSRDPYGLRRAALGSLRLLLESHRRFDLALAITPRRLLGEALKGVSRHLGREADPKAVQALDEFVTERLRFVFSRQFRYDEINAVNEDGLASLMTPLNQLAAFTRFHAISGE